MQHKYLTSFKSTDEKDNKNYYAYVFADNEDKAFEYGRNKLENDNPCLSGMLTDGIATIEQDSAPDQLRPFISDPWAER